MTAEVRRLLIAATVAAAIGLVHQLSARLLAGHDLLGALLNRIDVVTLLLGVVIAFTRALLFFLVPGWLIYRMVCVLLLSAQRIRNDRASRLMSK
jgi:uncharacterized membrane protein